MQRIVSKLPAFTGAAAGTQPTCTPDILGRSFEWFMIRVVGTKVTADAAMDHRRFITCVEILIDGKVSSVFYPKQEWQKLQNFNVNGDSLPTDTMLIPFARPGIPNSELGTADLRSVQIRVTVPATFATGGALTRIEGYMSYFLENVPRAEAFVNRVVTPVTPGAGENVIDRLDLGSIARLRNMYFVCPAAAGDLYNPAGAAITRVQVRVGDLDVFDMDTEMVLALLALHPLYKRATNFGFLVPLDLNNQAGDFQTVRVNDVPLPVRVVYNWDSAASAPEPFQIILEGTEGVKLTPKA